MEDTAIRQRLVADERALRRLVAACTGGGGAEAAAHTLRLNIARSTRALAACAADVALYADTDAELESLGAEIAHLSAELAAAQALRARTDRWDAVAADVAAVPSVGDSALAAAAAEGRCAEYERAEAAYIARIERAVIDAREAVSALSAVQRSTTDA